MRLFSYCIMGIAGIYFGTSAPTTSTEPSRVDWCFGAIWGFGIMIVAAAVLDAVTTAIDRLTKDKPPESN